jgi:hypothetical protein
MIAGTLIFLGGYIVGQLVAALVVGFCEWSNDDRP